MNTFYIVIDLHVLANQRILECHTSRLEAAQVAEIHSTSSFLLLIAMPFVTSI